MVIGWAAVYAITNLSRITVISMGITIRHIWNRWRVPYMRNSRERWKNWITRWVWPWIDRLIGQRGEDADYERYTVSPRLTLFYALPGESSIRLKQRWGMWLLLWVSWALSTKWSIPCKYSGVILTWSLIWVIIRNWITSFAKGLFYVNALAAYWVSAGRYHGREISGRK